MFERVKLHQLRDHIWLMNDADDGTGYLICGKDRALVIDTMNGVEDVHAIVRTLTDLPLMVVNTHWHWDHVCGDVFFDKAYIHPQDLSLAKLCLAEKCTTQVPLLPITQDDRIDLGGIHLEIYHTPGHTPGGICLLDVEDRILFTGDTIINTTWMQMEDSLPIEVLLNSLESLKPLEGRYDLICHGHCKEHGEPASLYPRHLQAVRDVCEGRAYGDRLYEWFGGVGKFHLYGDVEDIICYK